MTRQDREKAVVKRMITLYCRRHHHLDGLLCPDCHALVDYACRRISLCPHAASKTSCRKCATHCYAPAQREAIRRVMRYAGPRMLFVSPIDAIIHFINEL